RRAMGAALAAIARWQPDAIDRRAARGRSRPVAARKHPALAGSADRFTMLAVHNVDDGQGDEIIRVGPLVQALLDGIAHATVTILTRRTYLYDHPRVSAVPIHDDA